MSLPYLIYYISPNEIFGKQWTLNDIHERTEEEFSYFVSDCMTLGRTIPEFKEWATKCRQYELESNIKYSESELTIRKMCVTPETLEEELHKMDPTTVMRFIDPAVQIKFLELNNAISRT